MSEIIWEPSEEYTKNSNIKRFMDRHEIKHYDELIKRSTDEIEWFWPAMLEDCRVDWFKPWEKLMDSGSSKSFEWTKWFIGGKINIAYNSLVRHAKDQTTRNKPAFIWEGEDGKVEEWTYERLDQESNRFANALRKLGLQPGDVVGFYIPMIPELMAAFWGCLKAGCPFVPVFSGFGPAALAVRMEDCEAKLILTADGSLRRNKRVNLKPVCDQVADKVGSIEHILVVKRLGDQEIPFTPDRDLWWEDVVPNESDSFECEQLDSEDIAMILYSSGTTGKPKGTIHSHGGTSAQIVKELGYAFDVKPSSRFFWVTDIGWMMGPWQFIGVQHFGATHMLFEGAPNYPNADRVWEMVERHKITHLGISPTLIRLLMRSGTDIVAKHDLSSLKFLGSTGETWDPESYKWFFDNVGLKKCPIINISGGTEMVGCLLSPLPITALKSCTLRGPGLAMDIDVFDDDGNPVRNQVGHLVCKKPCPSFTRGFLKDSDRYIETYFSKWPKVWYHGDFASVDKDGFWFLHGRSDDTIKVAGKRTGPAEIESALLDHAAVSEAATIGVPHEIKGQTPVCFVVLSPGHEPSEELREELKQQVVKFHGKTLMPEDLKFVSAFPKTRSAKIVRKTIKMKYLGETDLGDISSIENPEAIDEIGKAH
ncbi:MAG: AMP-binding protein [Deltaproteobacteria bacterium]|nr:AMP-binding protein [Deltaproteobacteria bacterium]